MLYKLTQPRIFSDEYVKEIIIRANSEKQARRLANEMARAEGEIWQDKDIVDCIKIDREGEPEIVTVLIDKKDL